MTDFNKFDASSLPALLMDVGANDPIIVVHVVGQDVHGTSLRERLGTTYDSIMRAVPGACLFIF